MHTHKDKDPLRPIHIVLSSVAGEGAGADGVFGAGVEAGVEVVCGVGAIATGLGVPDGVVDTGVVESSTVNFVADARSVVRRGQSVVNDGSNK
jgi:hypothetical protein